MTDDPERTPAGRTPPLPDEAAVIERAAAGDRMAFTQLMDHYQNACYGLAWRLLGDADQAADATQDAFLHAYNAMRSYRGGVFRSWLLRIVTNTCYDYLRSQRRRSTLSLDDLTESSGAEFPQLRADELQNPEMLVTQQESLQFLLQAIDALPNWHRDVVLLVDVHGYDYTEAAEMLGLPLGTVKSRLSRARSALRDQLIKVGYVASPTATPLH